jgi:hypothetical protein
MKLGSINIFVNSFQFILIVHSCNVHISSTISSVLISFILENSFLQMYELLYLKVFVEKHLDRQTFGQHGLKKTFNQILCWPIDWVMTKTVCVLAKCWLAKCLLSVKRMLAKCLLSKCLSEKICQEKACRAHDCHFYKIIFDNLTWN